LVAPPLRNVDLCSRPRAVFSSMAQQNKTRKRRVERSRRFRFPRQIFPGPLKMVGHDEATLIYSGTGKPRALTVSILQRTNSARPQIRPSHRKKTTLQKNFFRRACKEKTPVLLPAKVASEQGKPPADWCGSAPRAGSNNFSGPLACAEIPGIGEVRSGSFNATPSLGNRKPFPGAARGYFPRGQIGKCFFGHLGYAALKLKKLSQSAGGGGIPSYTNLFPWAPTDSIFAHHRRVKTNRRPSLFSFPPHVTRC